VRAGVIADVSILNGETAHRIQVSWKDGLRHEDVIITRKK
jgi:hypothetical protein